MSAMKSPAAENAPQRDILEEEKKFDQRVYGGISYAAQALTGIILTRFLKYGGGKEGYEKLTKWLGPKIYNKPTVQEAADSLSSPLLVTIMVMVGNTFLLPVKWLENRKAKIVRGMHEKTLDRMEEAGTPCHPEELERREKALNDLEKEPVQSWASLLGGRAFGLVPVFAIAYGLGKKGQIAEQFAAKAISKGLETIGAKKLAQSKKLESYVHVGFLDVFYSMISAGGLYVYSHFVNPPKHIRNEGLIPDMMIGPTPGTPAINALEPGEKYEDYIDMDKHPQSKKFTSTIQPKTQSHAITPATTKLVSSESYQAKLANELKQEKTPALSSA